MTPPEGLAGAVIKIDGVDNSFTGTYTTGAGGYLEDVPWDTMPIGSYWRDESDAAQRLLSARTRLRSGRVLLGRQNDVDLWFLRMTRR